MTRVVIDTNIFVSSFFGGNPRKIIDCWKTGRITLCLSGPIINEYVEVLARLGLQDENQLEELLQLFARGLHVLYCAATPSLSLVDADPDDNKFIECAVALQARFIISGDSHLLAIREYMGIRIVGARDFLDIFNQV